MEFLKDKQDIIDWLKTHNITNYELISDEQYGFVADVKDDVDLTGEKLTHIPVKFSRVDGSFNCSHSQLSNLEFAPQQVGGHFDCSHNKLTSLEFCPQRVGGTFYCDHNEALKDTQSIMDFKTIYQCHRDAVIEKNYNQLNQSLTVIEPVSLQNNKVKAKL